MPEDLLKFGMIPEFIGRLPVFTSVQQPGQDRPGRRSSPSRRTRWCGSTSGCSSSTASQLEFTPDALEAIAEQATLRGTGARGLRAIMEEVLLNVMYDVPSRKDVGRVVITAEVVRDNVNPTLLPRETTAPTSRRTRQEKSA